MNIADFRIPGRLDEARSILRELGPAGLALAGATSLEFVPGKDPKTAVDITRLGLEGIARENGGFRIGATTRIAALQKHHEPGWVLDRVAVRLASQPIRNMSTIGGNIARVFFWADFPVALLALNATMEIDGETKVPADEFFASQPARYFKEGALLTAVHVPAVGPGAGFGYRKQTQAAMGFSLMTCAALLEADGNNVKTARVALGAGIPFPARLPAVEQALAGQPGGEKTFKSAVAQGLGQFKFKTAAGLSEEYITHLSSVVVPDALADAWAAAKGGAR
jgi:aerobic carbon-monoxide dehydrogenase medium subunit